MFYDRQSIIRLAILILLVSIGTYVFIHFDLYIYFISRKRAIALINSYSPYDIFVFIGLQILQVVFAPFPGEATGLIGGFLYGPILGTIYSTIGLTAGSWAAFGFSTILSGGVAFSLWYQGVKRIGVTRTVVYHYLVPFIAVLFAAFFLGERITLSQIVGGAAIISGVALVQRRTSEVRKVGS